MDRNRKRKMAGRGGERGGAVPENRKVGQIIT